MFSDNMFRCQVHIFYMIYGTNECFDWLRRQAQEDDSSIFDRFRESFKELFVRYQLPLSLLN